MAKIEGKEGQQEGEKEEEKEEEQMEPVVIDSSPTSAASGYFVTAEAPLTAHSDVRRCDSGLCSKGDCVAV